MPPKKGKKGKAGKKKGGGKGKKGAKGGKGKGKVTKAERKENVVKMAKQNAEMWEMRLKLMDKSRVDFRETAKRLADENSSLDDLLRRTEKDTIDVITYLKDQDQKKEDLIYRMNEEIKELKLQHRREKEALIKDVGHQLAELEEQLAQKNNDIQLMQNELRMVKEFRRKRNQMQKELEEIKDSLLLTEKDHQNTLSRLEQKFFEEKMRMQQESNEKISELADRAHSEAIKNLDEATRSVFKENVRLTEALTIHMETSEKLKIKVTKLSEERGTLRTDLETSETLMREKVAKNKKLREKVKQLEDKVESLEIGLNHAIREFEANQHKLRDQHATEQDSAVKEIQKLQRLLEIKGRESVKVKRLARSILEQRSEVEKFFLESLDLVRQEIEYTQAQYKQDAQKAYTRKMVLAHSGKAPYPAVRTFQKTDTSTNSVYLDMQAAEKILEEQRGSGKVDISDLTWEQRERVLRYLFARMNNQAKPQLTDTQASQNGQWATSSLMWTDNTQASVGGDRSVVPHKLPPMPAVGQGLKKMQHQSPMHLDERLQQLMDLEAEERQDNLMDVTLDGHNDDREFSDNALVSSSSLAFVTQSAILHQTKPTGPLSPGPTDRRSAHSIRGHSGNTDDGSRARTSTPVTSTTPVLPPIDQKVVF